MKHYFNQTARLKIELFNPAMMGNDCVSIQFLQGHNDCCPWKTERISLEEARDLRHFLDRVITISEQK